jgi:Family of unknown function (DUF5681)
MTRNNQAQKIAEPDNTGPVSDGPAHLQPWHYKPGQSGNPGGRPKSARSKLAEITLVRLLADFDAHGVAAIEEVRRKNPSHYLAAIVSLLPKQQEKVDSPFADLTDDELAQLELWLAASRAKNITIDATHLSDTAEPNTTDAPSSDTPAGSSNPKSQSVTE